MMMKNHQFKPRHVNHHGDHHDEDVDVHDRNPSPDQGQDPSQDQNHVLEVEVDHAVEVDHVVEAQSVNLLLFQ